jgi:hypothetical protein
LTHTTTWICLEDIILSEETSHSWKDKCCMVALT